MKSRGFGSSPASSAAANSSRSCRGSGTELILEVLSEATPNLRDVVGRHRVALALEPLAGVGRGEILEAERARAMEPDHPLVAFAAAREHAIGGVHQVHEAGLLRGGDVDAPDLFL